MMLGFPTASGGGNHAGAISVSRASGARLLITSASEDVNRQHLRSENAHLRLMMGEFVAREHGRGG